MVFYLSELLGNPVLNQSKEKVGSVSDLVIADINVTHPKISGLVIKRGLNKEAVFVPISDVDTINPKQIRLSTDMIDLTPFVQRNEEVLLSKDIYDKQIVDIDDRRLTRVNELIVESEKNLVRLKGVDVSLFGVMRRLGIPNLGLIKPNVVDWEDAQFLGGQSPVKFKIQYKNLEELHPVDIGRIIVEGPGYKYGSKLLTSLEDPIAADVLEGLSPKLQQNLIDSMKLADVADMVEHMRPDKAADMLLALGSEYAKKIMPLIPEKKAKTISMLLTYPPTSIGAFMTTEYLAVPANITIEQLFIRMSKYQSQPNFMYYLYVLENELSNKLVGVLSPHDYLKAELRQRVDAVMTTHMIKVYPHQNIKEAVKKMYRYSISALPVVSATDNKLLGIVTFRDAISIYLPPKMRTWS